MFEFLMNTWRVKIDFLLMYFTNLLIFFYFFEPDASLQTLIKPPFLPSHRTMCQWGCIKKESANPSYKTFQKHLSPLETKTLDHKNKQKLSLSLLTPAYEIQETSSNTMTSARHQEDPMLLECRDMDMARSMTGGLARGAPQSSQLQGQDETLHQKSFWNCPS